jgi:WD40 repeat protein
MISLSYEALSICVSTDDSTVVVAGEDGSIHIYSVASDTLTEVHTIEGAHMRPIHSVSLSHDGTKLASADVKDICVWDVTNSWASLVNKGRWCFHTQRIKCLAWSLDDTILASGGNDDSIYLWNLDKKMRRVHYPFAHRGGVTGLQFIQGSGMILASVGVDACINQWDVTDDVAKKFA